MNLEVKLCTCGKFIGACPLKCGAEDWQAKYDEEMRRHAVTCEQRNAYKAELHEWLAKYDALQQEFQAFKNTAAETETFLRGQRDQYWSGNIALKQERDELQTRCASLERVNGDLYDWRDSLIRERDELQARLDQQGTLEAVEAPATHVVNNYYGLDDERIRQMIRDEITRTFSRYGHQAS